MMKTGILSCSVVLLAGWSAQVAGQAAATCEEAGLTCHGGSACAAGSADFSMHPKDSNDVAFDFHKEDNKDGWHCECPDGMTGLRCNRPFEECGTTGHACYHGGKCLDGVDVDALGGEELLFCDCTDAQYDGSPMVGKFCEIQGTVQCGDTDIFCTNRGTCVDDFETKAHPCQCIAGHRGPHCEFDTGFVPECDLKCENRGECTLGIKSYEDAMHAQFWALHDGNFMYCSCPEGYYGTTCDVKGDMCGDKTCFNGATCLQTEHSDGDMKFTCDCSTANTDDKSFSGEFCENEASTFCAKSEDQNGQLFCVNGGTCKEDDHEGCECPPGFHGPICEYRDEIQTPKECRLQCQNGGRCRSGKRDNKLFEQFGDELKKFNETHRLWEHCVCPEGYFGIQCEHQLEICPGGEHVCLHGSSCVPQAKDEHACDCDNAATPNEKYAGKFCQYSSTDICTRTGKPGVGKANFAFCVNDGKCKAKVADNENHPGCNCPKGFNGQHCEFLQSVVNSSAQVQQDVRVSTNDGLIIGLAVGLLLLVLLVGGLLLRKYLSKSQVEKDTGKEDPSTPTTQAISPAGSAEVMEETVDMQSEPVHEGKNLRTVEII